MNKITGTSTRRVPQLQLAESRHATQIVVNKIGLL